MRPKVRQHGKIDTAHSFGKYFMRENRVNADAQHLSIPGFEFLAIFFEAA